MKKMDETTRQNVINILLNQYHMRPQGGGQRYKYGVCPACGKRDLWAFAHDPWTVQCDRESNCGYKQSMRELHPEAFATVTERALKQEPTDPKIIAKTYLQEERGLNTTRCGEFEQATAFNPKNQKSSATVRFNLPNGGYWERIIEDIDLPKALFSKNCPYKGYGWTSPEFDPKAEEIWIVEGIFDALALQQNGINAISAMTCHNFPDKTLEELNFLNNQRIVIALDSNEAGLKATHKFVSQAEEMGFRVTAALTNSKEDWNDRHLKNKLTPDDIKLYKYNGKLHIAKTVQDKALTMWARNGWSAFIVEHNFRTYWCEMDLGKYNKALEQAKLAEVERKELSSAAEIDDDTLEQLRENAFRDSGSLAEIGSCVINVLYAERSIATDESFFYLSIRNNRRETRGHFTGKHFKSPSEFGARIIDSLPGANFSANAKQLDALYNLKASGTEEVKTINYLGYCPEIGAYIYPDFAVKDGEIIYPNDEEFYTIKNNSIKSDRKPGSFKPVTGEHDTKWIDDFILAFGNQGLIVLTYFFASLFATQVRARYNFFPFLEFTGEAGSGKSTIIEFIWRLLGRDDYEGINPSISSVATRMRTLAQFSNMPTVFLEGQGEENSGKGRNNSWIQELNPMYNGRIIRPKSKRDHSNDTIEEPFLGSIVISQNRKVNAEDAIISRLIYLHMTREHHTNEGRIAAARLSRLESKEISSFLLFAIQREAQVLSYLESVYDQYVSEIMSKDGMKTTRLANNHAVLLAMFECLAKLFKIKKEIVDETREFIYKIARDRENDLNSDPVELDEFWYLYEHMTASGARLNHSNNEAEIAINLNEFVEIANRRFSKVADISVLRELLPTSKRHKFVANKVVRSKIENNKSVRCYVFKKNLEEMSDV